MESLNKKYKVIAIDKNTYTLDNGEVFEHQFELSDDITIDEFQIILDNSKQIINNIILNSLDLCNNN